TRPTNLASLAPRPILPERDRRCPCPGVRPDGSCSECRLARPSSRWQTQDKDSNLGPGSGTQPAWPSDLGCTSECGTTPSDSVASTPSSPALRNPGPSACSCWSLGS